MQVTIKQQAAEVEQVRNDRDALHKEWETSFGERSFGEVAAEIERLKVVQLARFEALAAYTVKLEAERDALQAKLAAMEAVDQP